jgi:hypothetical protein
MAERHASINDLPIAAGDQLFLSDSAGARPADHPGLSDPSLYGTACAAMPPTVALNSAMMSATIIVTGLTASICPQTWPNNGDAAFHVAAVIKGAGVGQLFAQVERAGGGDDLGACCLHGADRLARVGRQDNGVILAGRDDGLLPVRVHARLGRGDKTGAHLDTVGAEREGRRHAASVADAANGADWQVDMVADQRDQHHRRDKVRVLKSSALAALDHKAVDPRRHRLER